MKILNIPIEPLPERYSEDWDIWFKEFFELKEDIELTTIYGEEVSNKIEHGSFLDVVNTNIYKTSQLQKIMKYLKEINEDEKVVLFFHDLWFPGLINIAYIRDGLGLKNVFITGCLHAGSYDNFDFLAKQEMNCWAEAFEESLFNIADKVFVATRFHKNLINETFSFDYHDIADNICITGFPIAELDQYNTQKKEKIVVFPHRLDSEKQPDIFDTLAEQLSEKYPEWQFIKSKEVCKTKKEYYELLSKSYIAISTALQETWGIAMQEAVLLDCIPIVPNRLSYSEMYAERYKYETALDMLYKVELFIKKFNGNITVREQKNKFLESGRFAMGNMLHEIRLLS